MAVSNNSLNLNTANPLDLPRGGTGANLTASNGGIFYSTASAGAILAGTATANQVLLSGSSTTPAWSTATYLPTLTANEFLYASSSNTMAQLATANSAVLVTSSAGVPVFSGTMTNGQIIIGSTGATPTAATITAGSGISVTNGAGSITIAGTAGVSWANIAGTTQTAVVNTGYVVSNAAQTTITLPVTAPLGSIVEITGSTTATSWVLTPGAGQTIQIGSVQAATSVTSNNQWDSIRVVCVLDNTTWVMLSSVTNEFAIV